MEFEPRAEFVLVRLVVAGVLAIVATLLLMLVLRGMRRFEDPER